MLPLWILVLAFLSCLLSVAIILTLTLFHLCNYRKPFEQRLIIRIILILPLFAISCYVDLISPAVGKFLQPFREIYEAFVIYTFFSLLTHILGGERNIIVQTSGREPVSHPPPMKSLLAPFDISDPYTFLTIKRGILQYVWIKPVLLLVISGTQLCGVYDVNDISWLSVYVWTTLIYNCSVSLSLYDLALFWKCLYADLKPFQPMGKFLCVKMIIFASYWQGIILVVLNWLGLLRVHSDPETNAGLAIQNALLCIELIGFAIGHWYSFSYLPFTKENLPKCGRLAFRSALKDCLGIGDLAYDFRLTFSGSSYDYKQFDSVEAMLPTADSRMRRINQGMRYSNNGQKYWLDLNSQRTPLLGSRNPGRKYRPRAFSDLSSHASIQGLYSQSIHEEEEEWTPEYAEDDVLYKQAKKLIDGDPNCPVVIELDSYVYSDGIKQMRAEARARYNAFGEVDRHDSASPSYEHDRGYGSIA